MVNTPLGLDRNIQIKKLNVKEKMTEKNDRK